MMSLELSFTHSFWPHSVPGVDSASNKSEYQEHFLGGKSGRCIGLTTLPPSCADCLEILGASTLNPQGLSRPVMGLLLHTSYEAHHHIVFSITLSVAVLATHVILSTVFSDTFILCSSPEVRCSFTSVPKKTLKLCFSLYISVRKWKPNGSELCSWICF
jgi:hypothetical protein